MCNQPLGVIRGNIKCLDVFFANKLAKLLNLGEILLLIPGYKIVDLLLNFRRILLRVHQHLQNVVVLAVLDLVSQAFGHQLELLIQRRLVLREKLLSQKPQLRNFVVAPEIRQRGVQRRERGRVVQPRLLQSVLQNYGICELSCRKFRDAHVAN